jgi:hypothetical protein
VISQAARVISHPPVISHPNVRKRTLLTRMSNRMIDD